MGFVEWGVLRFAIGCRRRRKHDLAHAAGDQFLQKRQALVGIVFVIVQWVVDRLAYIGQGGKVDTSVDIVRCEYVADQRAVADLALV